MKQILILLTALILGSNSFSQQAEAQRLFEESEATFNKFMTIDCESNAQSCQSTLMEIATKLDKVEKIVGPKPKTVYLSALVQKRLYDLFDYSHLYDQEHGEKLFDLVYSLRETANQYLKMKQNDEVDNRYTEMRTILVELEKYPKDKVAWQKEKEKNDRVVAERAKMKEEKRQAFLAEVKEYDQKRDQYYREIAPKIDAWEYKEGIKIGMDINELKQSKKDWFKGHYKYKGGSAINRPWKKHNGDRFQRVELSANKKVAYYEFQIVQNSNSIEKDKAKILEKLKSYFGENLTFDEENFGDGFYCYVIKSPYSKNTIVVRIADLGSSRDISIMKMDNSWKSDYTPDSRSYKNAYNLNDLNRYTGDYFKTDGEGFTVNKADNFSLLEFEGSKPTYLYRKNGTDEFESYYSIENGRKQYYDKENKFQVIFNVEQGIMTLRYSNGQELTFTKEY